MKPVYFFGTRAKELAKRLHPVTNTRCLDLWTDGAEHYYLRTMRACGNRWRLHSFLLLPDWRHKKIWCLAFSLRQKKSVVR